MSDTEPLPVYVIQIAGQLDPAWAAWFNGLRITLDEAQPPVTTLSGPIVDQSHLRGILNKLWDLNLTLISINQVDPRAQP